MFYIPDDWIKDKSNKSSVYEILNKYIYTDLRDDNKPDPIVKVINELEEIGENIVVKKIKDGELSTGF